MSTFSGILADFGSPRPQAEGDRSLGPRKPRVSRFGVIPSYRHAHRPNSSVRERKHVWIIHSTENRRFSALGARSTGRSVRVPFDIFSVARRALHLSFPITPLTPLKQHEKTLPWKLSKTLIIGHTYLQKLPESPTIPYPIPYPNPSHTTQ